MNSLVGIPQLAVELNGMPLTPSDLVSLEEIRIEQHLSLPTQCELAFRDPSANFADSALSTHGHSLRVGIPGISQPLFEGEVTSVESHYGPDHSFTLQLIAYDLLHRLRKRQPARVHVQTTVAELARELTSDLDIMVNAVCDGPLLRRLIQHRQSDYELLVDALEPCGLYTFLNGTDLKILSLAGDQEAIPLTLGEELFEIRFAVNGDAACRSVSALAWDPSRAERHESRVSSPRSSRTASAEAGPDCFGGTDERRLTAEFAEDDLQAEALAQAELDRRTASEVTLRAVANGDPALMPGVLIRVRGVAGPLAGTHVLTAVTHRIERSTGYVSELSTEPPRARPRLAAPGFALGIVTRVDDPDGLGRVRVSLPAHSDVESDWMSVLSPGAGADKGITILPDTGDQVVVLFARDPGSHGIVIGGLYGSASPPDSVVESGAVSRYSLRTRAGRKLVFDDSANKFRIEDPAGNFLEFSRDGMAIHSVVPLRIEAIGQPIVIRGKIINFEEA